MAIPRRGYIAIPAALRLRCGLEPGDRVLLAGAPADETLTAYSLAVVHEAIRTHGLFPQARHPPHQGNPGPEQAYSRAGINGKKHRKYSGGPTAVTILRPAVRHPTRPAQVRAASPGRDACHGTPGFVLLADGSVVVGEAHRTLQ